MISNNRSISTAITGKMDCPLSFQTRQVLSLGQQNGWGLHVLGYADLPEKPVRLQNWLIVPAHHDSSPIPVRTMDRIQGIYAAGLRPQGFVVVHEAPMALCSPRREQSARLGLPAPAVKPPVDKPVAKPSGLSESTALIGLAEGLSTVITTFATIIFPMLFMGLLALDPIVVAVMEDGCWVEIDRWNIR